MRTFVVALFALVGCGGSPPRSLALTDGVVVPLDGCSFSVTTPKDTTAPVPDDGTVGAAPTPRNVHLAYPGDPTTTMVITWSTDVPTRGTQVDWGADSGYGHTTKGFSFAYPADFGGNDPPSVGVHQTYLCGLKPGTTYHYRVGTKGHMSDDFTFATAPADGRPVRILVVGDTRDDTATWHDVLSAGAAEAPDVAIFSGDAVDLSFVQDQWEAWFAAGQGVLEHLPFMTVNGNHENNVRHYYAQFPMPNNQQWYSFDFGQAHITALNDTPSPDNPGSITGAQAQFLDADLGKTTQKWRLVTHHRPEWTSSTTHGPATELQQAWGATLESRHVDLVLTGHAHDYERSYPLVGGQPVADGQGPVYIVEGGGGADPYGLNVQSFTSFAKTVYGYVILDVSAQDLKLTAKTIDGSVVDRYAITR
jgi:predicted phosphodiesterase